MRHPHAMDVTGPRPAGRFAVTSTVGLVVLVTAGPGLGWLLTDPIVALDRAVAAVVSSWVAPRPLLVSGLGAVTSLGADLTAAVVLATVAAALLIRGRPRLAGYVAVAGGGGAVIAPGIKELVGRMRPVVDVPVAVAPGPSFPSGHTLTATLWVGIVLLVLLPAVPARARRAVVAAGVTVVVAVGLTRIGLGLHHLSDVVAGWLLGVAWLAVTAAAFRHPLGLGGAPRPSTGLDPSAAADLAPAPERGSPSPGAGACAARLVVVAVLLLGTVVGVGMLLTRTAAGDGLAAADVAAVRWFAEHRTPVLDAVSVPASELGNTGVVITLGVVAAVLGLAVLRRPRPLVLLAVVLVGELALFIAAAGIVNRPRPPVDHLDAELPATASFPSGHTGAALCLYGAVAVLVFGATRAWWRWLVLAAAVSAIVLVALARIYRGAHHPSDVLGSVLLGLPWLLASAYLLGALPGSGAPAGAPSPPAPTPPAPSA